MIEVAAGIIRRADGRVLICRRGEGRHHAHLWEFPGGKLEAGESAEVCLARVVRHPALRDLPFCLETPNELPGYAREIALMRQLAE